MGCRKKGHIHTWPTKGTLTIQRCEVRCNFCTGDARYKDWKYAWFLRRHVRAIHVKKGKYKGMRVDAGWDDENPRDAPQTRRGSARIKTEPPSSDAGDGIPQTVGELQEGPMPDFITQPNFENFDEPTYRSLTNGFSNVHGFGHASNDYDMPGAAHGNLDAQLPTLAGEEQFGMEHTRITEEFQEFINNATGYDGSPEEPEEVEDEPLLDIDELMIKDSGEPVGNPVPSSSSGRFFMSDVSAPEPDFDDDEEEDDMPLAERMDNYNYAAHAPTDQAHGDMVHMLSGMSDTMNQSGMDAQQLLPVMHRFMRSFHHQPHASYPN